MVNVSKSSQPANLFIKGLIISFAQTIEVIQ